MPFAYDYLILATGARTAISATTEFAPFAPGMKSLSDAESVRAKVLKAFETAEIEEDPAKHHDLLTFVLVGGGQPAWRWAGALAELRRYTLKSDFRRINPQQARNHPGGSLSTPPRDLSRSTGAQSSGAPGACGGGGAHRPGRESN